jgi:hypothetical protein
MPSRTYEAVSCVFSEFCCVVCCLLFVVCCLLFVVCCLSSLSLRYCTDPCLLKRRTRSHRSTRSKLERFLDWIKLYYSISICSGFLCPVSWLDFVITTTVVLDPLQRKSPGFDSLFILWNLAKILVHWIPVDHHDFGSRAKSYTILFTIEEWETACGFHRDSNHDAMMHLLLFCYILLQLQLL